MGVAGPPILLDLDGTLVSLDPPRDELETLRSTMLGIASEEAVTIEHRGIFPMYRAAVRQLGFDSRAARSMRDEMDKMEVGWADRTARVLVAPTDLHRAARTRPLLLVTNNGAACVEALRRRGLFADAFTGQVTRDDVADVKPSPSPLVAALRMVSALTETPGDYVGDSSADSEAVHAYHAVRPQGFPRLVFHLVAERPNAIGTNPNEATVTIRELSDVSAHL